MKGLLSADSNQIINNLDELLREYPINNIVNALSPTVTIAQYNLLIQKGATNIDLSSIKNSVPAAVLLNNHALFKEHNIFINFTHLLDEMEQDDLLDPRALLAVGIDPTTIMQKYIEAGGDDLYNVQDLLAAGAKITPNDADQLIINLTKDGEVLDGFWNDNGEAVLMTFIESLGAHEESLYNLRQYLAYAYAESDTQPTTLDLVEDGPQLKKIFFVPSLQIILATHSRELNANWAGRVLPGQTVQEGIATELNAVYGYRGNFEYGALSFLDVVQDKKGDDIQRYHVNITLIEEVPDVLGTKHGSN